MSTQRIDEWCKKIIEGPGGMDNYERHEMVIWHEPERVAAAIWTIRCLANPRNGGSAEVLAAIHERREQVKDWTTADYLDDMERSEEGEA